MFSTISKASRRSLQALGRAARVQLTTVSTRLYAANASNIPPNSSASAGPAAGSSLQNVLKKLDEIGSLKQAANGQSESVSPKQPSSSEMSSTREGYRARVDEVMGELSSEFTAYANNPKYNFSDDDGFVDNFFRVAKISGRPIRKAGRNAGVEPLPQLPEDAAERKEVVNGYLSRISSFRYPRRVMKHVFNSIERFTGDPDILPNISSETLGFVLKFYYRANATKELETFVRNYQPLSQLAEDPLPGNYLLSALGHARSTDPFTRVRLALETVRILRDRHVPVRLSTWQCIYQLLNIEHSRELLESMLENGFTLDKMLWRIMERSRSSFPTAQSFLDFVEKNKTNFPSFNDDELLKVYCFYNDLDGIAKLLTKFAASDGLKNIHAKSVLTRFDTNHQIYNSLATVWFFHDSAYDLPRATRRQLFGNMLANYLPVCGYASRDPAGRQFLLLFVRYLFDRSLQTENLEQLIVDSLGKEFLNAVHEPQESEGTDAVFARQINETIRWTDRKIRLNLADNDEAYQELVRTFIYPEVKEESNVKAEETKEAPKEEVINEQ